MPTDSRTSAGSTATVEPATDACVMRAGCSISDSTPPSDSASVNSRVPRHDVERGVLAAAQRERDHAAEVAHLTRGDRRGRMVRADPGTAPASTAGWLDERVGDGRARSRSGGPCARASVLTPRSTR